MSKSILVIDTPGNCTECPLELGIGDTTGKTLLNANICRGCGQRNMDSMTKPDWCPLKDVPEKQEISAIESVFLRGAKNGYNTCIDEILKGVSGNE